MLSLVCRAAWLLIAGVFIASLGCDDSPQTPPLPPEAMRPIDEPAQPNEVVLHISGVETKEQRQAIQASLKTLADTPRNQSMRTAWGTGKPFTVRLTPVSDPAAFAQRIDFGTVDQVDGRTSHVTFDKTAP